MPDYARIPESTLETLTAWIKTGRPMGSFCEAVVANDLKEACKRADERNQEALVDIVKWLYNYAPIGSWGSPTALKMWPERVRAKKKPVSVKGTESTE